MNADPEKIYADARRRTLTPDEWQVKGVKRGQSHAEALMMVYEAGFADGRERNSSYDPAIERETVQ